jgi:hypothetical protein
MRRNGAFRHTSMVNKEQPKTSGLFKKNFKSGKSVFFETSDVTRSFEWRKIGGHCMQNTHTGGMRRFAVGSLLLPQIHSRQERCHRWLVCNHPLALGIEQEGQVIALGFQTLKCSNKYTTQELPLRNTFHHTFHHKPKCARSYFSRAQEPSTLRGTVASWIQINNLRGLDCCIFFNRYHTRLTVDRTIHFLIKIRKLLLSNVCKLPPIHQS